MNRYIHVLANGTAAQWATSTRVLRVGEPGLDTTNGVLKFGDGVQLWSALPADFASLDSSSRVPLAQIPVQGIADDPILTATIGAVGGAAFAPIRPALTGAFGGVLDCLLSGQSASWIHSGNSLWNAADEPIFLAADGLGDLVPSAHVRWKVWDDATQEYGAWAVIQAGDAGERHALFPASCRTMLTAPGNIPYIGGDIDIRVRLAADDWTPGTTQSVVARNGAAGARAWYLQINTNGALSFNWSIDGTALISKVSNPTGFTDGTERWIRTTLDVDNGAGGYTWKAYTSTDGLTWTEIGSSVDTISGATSLFNATAQEYEIGGRGQVASFVGKIYEVQIRDGINGKIANPQPIDSWMPRALSGSFAAPTFGGSPTLYVVNGSHPGANVAYLSDATRLPRLIPPHTSALVTFGQMHNGGAAGAETGPAYLALLDAWFATLKARVPGAGFGTTTENPQISPRTIDLIRPQEQRRREVISWAARNAVTLVDTWQAILDDGRALSALIPDSLHWGPGLSGGSGVAARALLKAFTLRS